MRIIAVFAIVLSVTFPTFVHGQVFGGVGVRAEGMAGAFVAVADDASATFWNPAGIATGSIFDLQASAGSRSTVFVGAALPMLGASYYRTRHMTALPTVLGSPDRQNEGSGEVQIRALTTSNAGVTVVQTVVPGLVIGTTPRVVWGGMDGFERRSTVDLDAGAMVSAWDIRLGLSARNLREPEFQTSEGVIALKRQFRVGAALTPRALPTGVHGPYTLAVDVDLTTTPDVRGNRRMAAIGGEYWVGKGLVGARGGVRWSTLGDSRRAFSGGFTVRLPRSLYVEGQVTKDNEFDAEEFTAGGRVTF